MPHGATMNDSAEVAHIRNAYDVPPLARTVAGTVLAMMLW